jgi:hypothetical protein
VINRKLNNIQPFLFNRLYTYTHSFWKILLVQYDRIRNLNAINPPHSNEQFHEEIKESINASCVHHSRINLFRVDRQSVQGQRFIIIRICFWVQCQISIQRCFNTSSRHYSLCTVKQNWIWSVHWVGIQSSAMVEWRRRIGVEMSSETEHTQIFRDFHVPPLLTRWTDCDFDSWTIDVVNKCWPY